MKSIVGRRIKIGELAKLTGKSVRALHLYEELGLLHPVERSKGGFRLYAPDAVTRVRWISHLNELGFSLTQIQGFRSDWAGGETGPQAMAYVKELYLDKLAETKNQVEKLILLKKELEESLRYLETCGTACDDDHGVDACPKCTVGGPERAASPALVAGFYKG
jgi:DNA-binding transcriptional MerR regulator